MAGVSRRTFVGMAAALGGTTIAAGTTGCGLAQTAISVAVPWSGRELQAFRTVLDALQIRDYRVDLIPLGDNIDAAFSATDASRPDVVMLPRLGLVAKYWEKELEPLPSKAWPYTEVWDNLLFFPDRASGRPYGRPFKLANKSAIWYRKSAFQSYDLEPPTTFDEWIALNRTLARKGIPPLAIPAADGWTLTDILANLLRLHCGPALYEQLAGANPSRPWGDPKVTDAFELLGELFSTPGALAGGVTRTLVRQFPDAIVEVFGRPDKQAPAMVPIPDFAESVIWHFSYDENDVDVFHFPSVPPTAGHSLQPVVAGGDVAVVPKPAKPESLDLVNRLANPLAPAPWVSRYGGFLSAHIDTSEDLYSPPMRELADWLTDPARDVVFDLSDRLGRLGASEGLWRVLQDLLVQVGNGGRPRDAARAATRRMSELEKEQ